jgi:hypothetical protein
MDRDRGCKSLAGNGSETAHIRQGLFRKEGSGGSRTVKMLRDAQKSNRRRIGPGERSSRLETLCFPWPGRTFGAQALKISILMAGDPRKGESAEAIVRFGSGRAERKQLGDSPFHRKVN